MRSWTLWCAVALTGLWSYVVTVFLYGEPIFGHNVGLAGLGVFILAGAVFIYGALARLTTSGRIKPSHQQDLLVTATVSLACILTLDVVLAVMLAPAATSPRIGDRGSDPNSWIGEIYPHLYYPTDRNFRLHKPDVQITASHYGDLYSAPALQSPTVRDSILSRKRLTIAINDAGFRDSSPIRDATIVALGDSFTFGWGVEDAASWVTRLEKTIGEPVYNLGIHDSSPLQELFILRYVLERYAPPIKSVLWMIYEGNDLEDSYSERRQAGTDGKRLRSRVAPSAARLHADQFEDFPRIAPPAFARHVVEVCGAVGVKAVICST